MQGTSIPSQTTEQSSPPLNILSLSPQPNVTLPHSSPQLGRGHRIKKPKKRDDWLPEGPAPPPDQMEPVNDPEPEVPIPSAAPRQFIQITPHIKLILVEKYWTMTNSFGISRLYYGKPSCIPDHLNSAADLVSGLLDPTHSQPTRREIQDAIWPYPNISSWRLGRWLWNSGDTKSLAGFKDLVNNVLLAEDFRQEDLAGIQWDKIHSLLAETLPGAPEGEGWCQASVDIQVPTGVKKKVSDKSTDLLRASKTFTVPGLWYRPICTVIKSVFSDNTAASMFHFNPFKQFWNTSSKRAERVCDELFNSDEWLRIQEKIEAIPREANDDLPRCVAALMFSSDATHLAQFGQAKLWPVYLFFGNQSKWTRCKPSAHTSHHLPDSVIEFIRSHVSSGAADALKTHCRRELFHAALNFLFDEKFLEAWKKGIVIDCIDGVRRRVFPRIFTWSADYPENDAVNQILMSESLTPTENAFSKALYSEGFNIFNMLVVDLMHEIELGVWKALFTHLVRMLYSIGETSVDELNARFRLIPTFGVSTIRPFAADVSQMKKLAVHNFEDILQGLFGEWDNKIQELLFTLSYWHGLAKLRMHTDTTIGLLDDLTSNLGKSLRFFQNIVCPNFETFDTPAEKAAQARARMRTSQKAGTDISMPESRSSPKRRIFNMKTFKIHELGYYVSDILSFGTTDSYSTQIGELEHRIAKSRYRHRTNKNQFTSQLTKLSQQAENIE
ncbi:hypothetical protein Clacol_007809 [Clathrus columnatus]|uniref:Uncharacterized protein n=1 Tax=Clathrus columnatus TaxID=1419009 RepID=A0AAV5ALH6_9AGAM|nr:hypothetical protein Clacol_007809 [Clathrus columnatus]